MNWYQRRLSGGDSTPPRSSTPPQRPASAPPPPPSPPQPHTQRPPQSSLQDETCPACGSTNYMAPQGTKVKRCMECGYPIVQSGSGVGGVGQTDGSVKAAKQPDSGGYHPTQIVGRVD